MKIYVFIFSLFFMVGCKKENSLDYFNFKELPNPSSASLSLKIYTEHENFTFFDDTLTKYHFYNVNEKRKAMFFEDYLTDKDNLNCRINYLYDKEENTFSVSKNNFMFFGLDFLAKRESVNDFNVNDLFEIKDLGNKFIVNYKDRRYISPQTVCNCSYTDVPDFLKPIEHYFNNENINITLEFELEVYK